MPARPTVFCSRSVRHVRADDILASIREADLYTVAEGSGIEGEAVDQAKALLRIERLTDPFFELHYRPPGLRGGAEGAGEHLPTGDGLSQVRSHLGRTLEVVGLQLDWSQLENMDMVLASQVAE